MARYIDADKLKNDLAQACVHKAIVTNVLDRQPTADVVPKSEVEKFQEAYNNRLAKDIQTNAEFVKYAKAEVAGEIFAEIHDEMLGWYNYFNEVGDTGESCAIMAALTSIDKLKKKYTGGDNNVC